MRENTYASVAVLPSTPMTSAQPNDEENGVAKATSDATPQKYTGFPTAHLTLQICKNRLLDPFSGHPPKVKKFGEEPTSQAVVAAAIGIVHEVLVLHMCALSFAPARREDDLRGPIVL